MTLDGSRLNNQASGLTLEEGRAIARFITGKEFSSASDVPLGKCEGAAKTLSIGSSDWSGWSVEPDNSRYQPKPGLSAADIPWLKVKWAFGFPWDSRAYAQPAVVGGRVFVGSANGTVCSLDAATGCTYWSFKAEGSVRTAINIARSKTGGRYIDYFGDLRATAYAVDASSGTLIWKLKLDNHPYARITGSPIYYNGRLFVPMASFEEASGVDSKSSYECCTSRGSLASLDAETGQQLWKSFTVLDPPKAHKKNKNGGQQYGPAGAGVWSAPTIDAKRKLVYVATGDSYTDVEINTSDAIMAFNIDNGSLVWASQVTPKDNYIYGCPVAPNCPEEVGPDYDFGSSRFCARSGAVSRLSLPPRNRVWFGASIRTKKERSSRIRNSAPAVYTAGLNGGTAPMAKTPTSRSPTSPLAWARSRASQH